jgi:DNA-binding GntR family transcriptional regulator
VKQHRVYLRLRQAIYSGEIKPGEKLVERQLAEQFDTSRVPLRESLLRLMSEGLVRRTPRKTSYVDELTADDVAEIWLMRQTLEPLAARLAALRPNRTFVKRLFKLADRMADELQRGCRKVSAGSDLEFHRLVVEASQAPRLIRAYDQCHVPMLMSRLEEGDHPELPEALRRQHWKYVELIERGDADGVERYARDHVIEVAQRWRKDEL